jgi:hypothetical protein
VTGTGFAPGRPVAVAVADFPETMRTKASPEGRFRVSLLVFPKTRPGQRIVTATVVGAEPKISAKKPMLVSYGLSGPPDFLFRR